jgi:hypothetical protein
MSYCLGRTRPTINSCKYLLPRENSPYKSIGMSLFICGATNRRGMPCGSLVGAMGKRCRFHGGYSTGPITPLGKLRRGLALLRVRINPPKGIPKSDKARLRREASIKRMIAWRSREERRQARALRWEQRKAIASGLPLYCEALGSSDSDNQSSGSSGNETS